MSEQTAIEWATHSFNPWIGCTKVSPGCLNCYAEVSTPARVLRKGAKETWGKGAKRQRTSAGNWKLPVRWQRAAGHRPALRPRVFPSLCDWLDGEVPVEWLVDFLTLIHETPHLDWLLLTKRPDDWYIRMARALDEIGRREGFPKAGKPSEFGNAMVDWLAGDDGPANVWLGASVEDQKRAEERIPKLLGIPAVVRFLSVEPLLERVNLHLPLTGNRIDWVIVGGESGPGARPCDQGWIVDVLEQCKAAFVPCFVKQRGSNAVTTASQFRLKQQHPKGGDPLEWPRWLRVREFPRVAKLPRAEVDA